MTARDQIFLFCYLIYGHQKEEILNALPSTRAESIRKEARKYDRFPKDVRLNLILKLFGYLVRHARNKNLEMVHPSWISNFLQKESPMVVRLILNQFSPEYQKQVISLLSHEPGAAASTRAAEFGANLYQIFQSHFVSMTSPWGDPQISLDTMYLFRLEDVLAVAQKAGVYEMARAFSPAGKDATKALANRFPEDLQAEFFTALTLVAAEAPERQKRAAKRMRQFELGSTAISDAAVRVGLVRIGSALRNRRESAKKIAQRLPHELGLFLMHALDQEPALTEEENEIGETIQKLASEGKIDKGYVNNRFLTSGELRRSTRRVEESRSNS